ncbi:LUD domain-containing protein [Hymenobacter sp. BT188]|uniref:LutC/YkgG family protein n=1 Tax=Hymenobacter sp. BT188 TaxID=2763504 RepID=UPI0016515F87|nr:LUD domain-containing protein [Hymenobacter sp. BT188]MBC6607607.1 LUD domain-containing protein [Hymenobacter sp. BT188]
MTATARERILAATRANHFEENPLPTVPQFTGDASVERFTEVLQSIGGQIVRIPVGQPLAEVVQQLFPAAGPVASPLLPATITIDEQTPTAVLDTVDVAVLGGIFGVAENGCIWLPEANMLHRALPLITQHLVLVLSQQNIVATMHQAYALVTDVGDYGMFIAGPSKTADIEQSLVIGAHGARSLTVLLTA